MSHEDKKEYVLRYALIDRILGEWKYTIADRKKVTIIALCHEKEIAEKIIALLNAQELQDVIKGIMQGDR